MLILATIAAMLILLISIQYSPHKITSENDRILVGTLFIVINILGVYSAFRPGQIRYLFTQHNKKKTLNKTASKTPIKIQGHHPTCIPFSIHVFQYKNRRYCTGCFGLALGALSTIPITIGYILYGLTIPNTLLFLLLVTGLLLIIINYLEIAILQRTVFLHLISNALLILGFLLITLSILEKTGEVSFGIITIIFSLLWLDTRIQLSQFFHKRICHSCNLDCKYFE